VSFECRLTQFIQLKTVDDDTLPTWLTLGQVVGVHIANSLLQGDAYDTAAARPILRGGGSGDYFEIRPDDLFRMTRHGSRES
jgi:flavin reductase (DIM6/NTAB) family NADH-FMN oxidoreductase RutF